MGRIQSTGLVPAKRPAPLPRGARITIKIQMRDVYLQAQWGGSNEVAVMEGDEITVRIPDEFLRPSKEFPV